MSDTDRARHEADERLDTILGQLEPSGARVAGGAVGDDTPMTVVEDHVRGFRPDRIALALRGREHADWQERTRRTDPKRDRAASHRLRDRP
jgi:hypothetical protein